MEKKQEVVQPQRLLEQVMAEVEEEAGIDSIEDYATTTFGDELIRVQERRGDDPDRSVSGQTYEEAGIPAQSFHKGKKRHEMSTLALAAVVGNALENPELQEKLDDDTQQMAQSASQTSEVRFTDY